MKVVSTFHPSSCILDSVKCALTNDANVEQLVVAKINSLTVYDILPEGLVQKHSLDIWGNVLTVKAIPIANSSRSNLLVLLDHPDPELIFLTYQHSKLVSKKHLLLRESGKRATQAEYFNDVVVDPLGTFALASIHPGKLKYIGIKSGAWETDYDILLPEPNLLSLAIFAPESDDGVSTVAILHYIARSSLDTRLVSRDLIPDQDSSTYEFSQFASVVIPQTMISTTILPTTSEECLPIVVAVPAAIDSDDPRDRQSNNYNTTPFLGGVLVFGGRRILFYERASQQKQEKHKLKKRRLEEKKSKNKSTGEKDELARAKALEKEQERESRSRKATSDIMWPWGEIAAWCVCSDDNSRYMLGDAYGRLAMLHLDFESRGMTLIPLGQESSPKTLTYLSSSVIFLGSNYGDSQLIRLSSTPLENSTLTQTLGVFPRDTGGTRIVPLSHEIDGNKGKGKARQNDNDEDIDDIDPKYQNAGRIMDTKGSYLEVLNTFKNIGPINDAVLVDSNGQKQIITCSGDKSTGSINVVRSGADFQELAVIDGMQNVIAIWPIKTLFDDRIHTHILLSTAHQSFLFQFDSKDVISVVEGSASDFTTDHPTIVASNVVKRFPTSRASIYDTANSGLVVQVTPARVLLLDYDMSLGEFRRVAEWVPQFGHEIVAGSVNASQVAIAVFGKRITVLSICSLNDTGDEFGFLEVRSWSVTGEVSALSITPIDPDDPSSRHIVASYWETRQTEIFMLKKESVPSIFITAPLPALPRSVLLFNFGLDKSPKDPDYRPYLIVGTGNGLIWYFEFIPRMDGDSCAKEKIMDAGSSLSLGHGPVSIKVIQVDGRRVIFAGGDRAMVLSWEKNRVVNWPVQINHVEAAAQINTPEYDRCVLVASRTGLFIGRVKDLDRLHIRSFPMGYENPQRIAHSRALGLFGVTSRYAPPRRVGDLPIVSGSFMVMDDISLEVRAKFELDVGEETSSVHAFSIELNGRQEDLFCVGTYQYDRDEPEPTIGRILILKVNPLHGQGLQLVVMAEAPSGGCVYAIDTVNGMLALAINPHVKMFRLTQPDNEPDSPMVLTMVERPWGGNYLTSSLAAHGSNLIVGCPVGGSIAILDVSEEGKLTTLARDHGSFDPIQVQPWNRNSYIISNVDNFFTFVKEKSGNFDVLKRTGGYHIDDCVPKFIRGSVASVGTTDNISTNGMEPRQLFFTRSGRIGAIIEVTDEHLAETLTHLQRNLAFAIKGTGGISHPKYRAPRLAQGPEEPASGFLDGDFMELFLSTDNQAEVLSGESDSQKMSRPISEYRKVLESLQALH